MRITSISIKNYRQYKDLSFEFDKNKRYDMHVLIAKNGVGKTNFLNAITWCLYEIEPHLGDGSKSLPLLNLDVLNDLNNGEKGKVEVLINIKVNDLSLTIKRSIDIIKNDSLDEKCVPEYSDFEIIVRDPNNGLPKTLKSNDASEYVNRILPENINKYFFFDNEQLDTYFITSDSGEIRKAIEELSHISVLKRTIRHLSKINNDNRKIVSKGNSNLALINAQIDSHQMDIDRYLMVIEECEREIAISEKSILEANIKLNNAPDIAEIESKIDALKIKRNSLLEELSKKREKLHSFIKEFTIILNLFEELKTTYMIIEKEEDNGNVPIDVSLEILEKVINDNKCEICDRELDLEALENVKDMIKEIKFSNATGRLLISIKSELRRMILRAKNYETEKVAVWGAYVECQGLIEEISDEITDLSNEVNKYTNTDILKENKKSKDAHEKSLEKNKRKLDDNRLYKKKSEVALEKKFDEYNKELSKERKVSIAKSKFDFTSKGLDVLRRSQTELINEMKKNVEEETFSSFDRLVWKKETFKEVKIDENFNLDLIHKNGFSSLGSSSAAERSLLALSFTLALHKVSGFNAPLVIDSPVGRISDENRSNFASRLKNESTNKQIIMLFTPSEFSDEVQAEFKDDASNIISLNSNEIETKMEVL